MQVNKNENEYEITSDKIEDSNIKMAVLDIFNNVENDGANEGEDDDEETIATFVTSTGQQLVLYSVENSEDFFAVGVYDESGEPPDHFEFLMKSDVEKLIGEGAIQTIKKPSKMKSQVTDTSLVKLNDNFSNQSETEEKIIFKEEYPSIEVKPKIVCDSNDLNQSQSEDNEQNETNMLSYSDIVSNIFIKTEKEQEVYEFETVETAEEARGQNIDSNECEEKQDTAEIVQKEDIKKEKQQELESNETDIIKDLEVLEEEIEDECEFEVKADSEYSYYEEIEEIEIPISDSENSEEIIEYSIFNNSVADNSSIFDDNVTVEQVINGNAQTDVDMTYEDIKKSLGITVETENEFLVETESDYEIENDDRTENENDLGMEFFSPYQSLSENNLSFGSHTVEIKIRKEETNKIPVNKTPQNQIKTIKNLIKIPIKNLITNPVKPPIKSQIKPQIKPQIKYQIVRNVEILKPLRRINTKRKQIKSALLNRRVKNDKHTLLIHGTTALICRPIDPVPNNDSNVEPSETLAKETPDSSNKVKRPRKQQLTINDRTDSEIIIQPATLVSDEEDEELVNKNAAKKRPRKKRKENTKKKQYQSAKKKKRLSKINKNERRLSTRSTRSSRIVELIEIDVDEEEKWRKKNKNIEEITIDDSKEKGSSDKENNVIMIRDSDEENDDFDDEDETEIVPAKKIQPFLLTCDHCGRSFKLKRALCNHLRICERNHEKQLASNDDSSVQSSSSKTPDDSANSSKSNKNDKKYNCKICNESFDVVVVLARHVRSHQVKQKQDQEFKIDKKEDLKKKVKVNTRKLSVKISRLNINHNLIINTSSENENQKNINENDTSDENSSDDGEKEELVLKSNTKNVQKSNQSNAWKSKKMNCIDCGKWFPSATLLSAHRLQHATKISDKQPRRCLICKKIFATRVSFIQHLQTHKRKRENKKSKKPRQSSNKLMTLRKRPK